MALSLLGLTGKRALVTGAGTGLGRQMALGLAEAGADLVICGRRRAPLDETAELARAHGVGVQAVTADVTVGAGVQGLADEAGRGDILVNNAGGGRLKPGLDVTMEDWRQTPAVNLDAPFRLIQLFAPQMMEPGWGRITTIPSIYGLVGPDRR